MIKSLGIRIDQVEGVLDIDPINLMMTRLPRGVQIYLAVLMGSIKVLPAVYDRRRAILFVNSELVLKNRYKLEIDTDSLLLCYYYGEGLTYNELMWRGVPSKLRNSIIKSVIQMYYSILSRAVIRLGLSTGLVQRYIADFYFAVAEAVCADIFDFSMPKLQKQVYLISEVDKLYPAFSLPSYKANVGCCAGFEDLEEAFQRMGLGTIKYDLIKSYILKQYGQIATIALLPKDPYIAQSHTYNKYSSSQLIGLANTINHTNYNIIPSSVYHSCEVTFKQIVDKLMEYYFR